MVFLNLRQHAQRTKVTSAFQCLLLFPRTILNRLRQMRRFDLVAPCQVRNRPREFDAARAMKRPRTHLHLLHRRMHQTLPRIVHDAVLPHLRRHHIAVALQVRASESLALPLALFFDARANRL